jgi:hypothetical protein
MHSCYHSCKYKSLQRIFAHIPRQKLERHSSGTNARAMAMVDTVQGLNRWIERCNNAAIDMCCPFVVNDRILGYIPPDFASLITKSDVFQVCDPVLLITSHSVHAFVKHPAQL